MKTFLLFVVLVHFVFPFASNAQVAFFPKSGVIEYEKRINVFAILEKKAETNANAEASLVLDAYKKDNPQFITLNSKLRFNKEESLFVPENSPPSPLASYFGADPLMTQINTVYMNPPAGSYIVQKNVLGNTYLLQDTLLNIKWRITDERREIAGHLCRRANGLMQDSIYVVAFYTNDIHLSVGPESFHGLPGAILGVALPHYHVSWFAKRVYTEGPSQKSIQQPTKGQPVRYNELRGILIDLSQSTSSVARVIDRYLF